MPARWSASLVWALAAALAVFWGLRLFVPAQPVPSQARLAEAGGALAGDLTRLLGAAPVAVRRPTPRPASA
ncbi:hypothetical protein ABXN37_29195 [Piscinibacter sakaiensis]|uniref:hypothetical protein n=1 Tax=Piscinibacter sakaiensis TaxID=1547922 RepID=UPI003728F207